MTGEPLLSHPAPPNPLLLLGPDDDVAIVTRDLAPGERLGDVVVRDHVPRGHKLAVRPAAEGATVRKYGQRIGVALRPIEPGEHVHGHNLGFVPGEPGYELAVDNTPLPPVEPPATFDGIVRPDGRVATRTYVGILTSVNCSATVATLIARRAEPMLAGVEGVDGVIALTHGTGCGMTADGEGMAILRRTLAGYARHPNFAALLFVGLGCEVAQIADIELDTPTPVHRLVIQDTGGTAATVRAALETIEKLLPEISEVRRRPVPASELVLGLQCGGSDGYSGITANPALGAAADLLVRHGGTAVLGETPEVYGAEHLLTRRATTPDVARRLLHRIRWWEEYTARHGGSVDNNPSPGNKAGGLTTILEKSLGAVAKGGTSPLTQVVEYAEPVTSAGLVFMDTPGYDPVSVTGMVAGGVNVVAFTTGRGSVFGCRPVPSLKLATNTPMYERMRDDMDLDCGGIVDGTSTVEAKGEEIFRALLDVASGRKTRSEDLGVGGEEFVPWQLGAVL